MEIQVDENAESIELVSINSEIYYTTVVAMTGTRSNVLSWQKRLALAKLMSEMVKYFSENFQIFYNFSES